MTIADRLIENIREAASFNPDIEEKPHCILWTDHDRQWETLVHGMISQMPELFILGDYDPGNRKGPAIWLRCVMARQQEGEAIPKGAVPVFYLPGVSRGELKDVRNCEQSFKVLAELQYRGKYWSQLNGKDWTLFAFLKSAQGGLGLDVAQDRETLNALHLAARKLLDEDLDLLGNRHLDADFFNGLLTGGDPVRDILMWLDGEENFRLERDASEWQAFVGNCKSQFAFNPEADGILCAASRLASHEGPWKAVWDRYCEAPERYPHIPDTISRTPYPSDLFADRSGWPKWNDEQEKTLRTRLVQMNGSFPTDIREQLREMEKGHGMRREWIWARLGRSPLARALEHLCGLADRTETPIGAGSFEDLAAAYRTSGWKADDAVLRCMACVDSTEDKKAVADLIRALYLPWADGSARYLQKIALQEGYPGGQATARVHGHESTCILFVDGLRFDAGQRLKVLLESMEMDVNQGYRWAPLPSVTATGKPAVSPVAHLISGGNGEDFSPAVAGTEQSLQGGHHLKRLLKEEGWNVLGAEESGTGNGKAWCSFGDIDQEGHERGWKMARTLDGILEETACRIKSLLEAGWETVRVVTDHGWLLVPEGLPKSVLPASLAESKWGRCAVLKEGAQSEEDLFPWYWDPNRHFALAGGISCYRSGEEYAHGGLSLQECLTPVLTVSLPDGRVGTHGVNVHESTWKGLRCTVKIGDFAGELLLDIRTRPADPAATIASVPKPFKENGTASIVVPDEDLTGEKAFLVILDDNGNLVAQILTTIGGGEM